MGFKVLAVAVPPGASHFDEWNPRFNQSPGNQALFLELRRSVEVSGRLRFLVDVKQLLAGHDSTNAFVRHAMAGNGRVVAFVRKPLSQQLLQISPFLMINVGERFLPANVRGNHAFGQKRRSVASSQESSPSFVAPFGLGIHRDIVGHLTVGSTEFSSNQSSQIRVIDRGFHGATRFHQTCTATVIGVSGIE